MIDAEQIVYELYRDALPDEWLVASDLDVDVLEHLPALLFTLTGGGQVANGRGLWSYTLGVNIFADGISAAKAGASLVYDVSWAWNDDPQRTVVTTDDGSVLGWVNDVSDLDLPSRLPSALIGARNLTQYSGSFGLELRSPI